MKGVQLIIAEIEKLPTQELELVLQKIVQKIHRSKKIKAILLEYQGIGQGIWMQDAQDYVNELREEDRV